MLRFEKCGPSLIIRWDNVSILVDCAFGTESEGDQGITGLPVGGAFDAAHLDAVILCNYSAMSALPTLVCGTSFKGQVFATEPTARLGQAALEELSAWSVGACGAPYTCGQVSRACSQIHPVTYNQSTPLDCNPSVSVTPVSSGPSSVTTRRHPVPLDTASLQCASMALFYGLASSKALPPAQQMQSVAQAVQQAMNQSRDAMILTPSFGLIYDLITYLRALLLKWGMPAVEFAVVGPAACFSLHYASICTQWVCKDKQHMDYPPQYPFTQLDMVEQGTLHLYRGYCDPGLATKLKNTRTPMVILLGHLVPSWLALRCVQEGAWPCGRSRPVVLDLETNSSTNLPPLVQSTQSESNQRLPATDPVPVAASTGPGMLHIPMEMHLTELQVVKRIQESTFHSVIVPALNAQAIAQKISALSKPHPSIQPLLTHCELTVSSQIDALVHTSVGRDIDLSAAGGDHSHMYVSAPDLTARVSWTCAGHPLLAPSDSRSAAGLALSGWTAACVEEDLHTR
eukprot:gene7824-1401_t